MSSSSRDSAIVVADNEEIEALIDFHRLMIEGARESGELDEVKQREARIAELKGAVELSASHIQTQYVDG